MARPTLKAERDSLLAQNQELSNQLAAGTRASNEVLNRVEDLTKQIRIINREKNELQDENFDLNTKAAELQQCVELLIRILVCNSWSSAEDQIEPGVAGKIIETIGSEHLCSFVDDLKNNSHSKTALRMGDTQGDWVCAKNSNDLLLVRAYAKQFKPKTRAA